MMTHSFELENCFVPFWCTCDHVEVRDGKDRSATELDKFCGNDKPSSLRSTGRYMWVEFESDFRTTRKGFHATFKGVSKYLASSTFLTQSRSTLKITFLDISTTLVCPLTIT